MKNSRIYTGLRFINLKGLKFGKLTVIKYNPKNKDFKEWLCKCECGKYVFVPHKSLELGLAYSCGCFPLNVKHGLRRLASKRKKKKEPMSYIQLDFYKKWYNMRQMCNYSYGPYFKQGISYDKRWDKFLEFKKDFYFKYLYALFNKKYKRVIFVRKDVTKDFSVENCEIILYRRHFQTEAYRQQFIIPLQRKWGKNV